MQVASLDDKDSKMSEEIVYVYYLFHDTQEFVHVENAIEIKLMDFTVEFFKKLNRISSRDDVIYFYINGKRVMVCRRNGCFEVMVDAPNGSFFKENIEVNDLFDCVKIGLLHHMNLEEFGFSVDESM